MYTVTTLQNSNGNQLYVNTDTHAFYPKLTGYLYQETHDHGYSTQFSKETSTLLPANAITHEMIIEKHILPEFLGYEIKSVMRTDDKSIYEGNACTGTITAHIQICDLVSFLETTNLNDHALNTLRNLLRNGYCDDEYVSYEVNMNCFKILE
jgi:hypothetical protein